MTSLIGGTGRTYTIDIYCAADVVCDSQVFPSHVKRTGGVTKGGALESLRAKRHALAGRTNLSGS